MHGPLSSLSLLLILLFAAGCADGGLWRAPKLSASETNQVLEAVYRYQLAHDARPETGVFCLDAPSGDPPATLLQRFSGEPREFVAYSACKVEEGRIVERATGKTKPRRPIFVGRIARYGNLLIPHAATEELDGKMIYDREVCKVHQVKMEHKEVPIVYGLIRPRPGEPSGETERRLFPHQREVSFGGCVVNDLQTEKVYVCSQCKEAYEKWKKENPPPIGAG